MKKFLTDISACFLSTLLVAQSGQALPKHSKTSRINGLQSFAISQDPVLRGSQIIADDSSDVLYVSPSSKKSQAGVFQLVALPACDILKDNYDLTYLMPNVPVDKYADFALKGPYSPFFDAKLGNYVRQSGMLNRIAQKIDEIDRIKADHKNIVAAYERIKMNFREAQAEYSAAEISYAALSKRIESLSSLLIETADSDERSRIERALDEARLEKEKEGPELKERYRLARRTLVRVSPQYAEAKSIYDVTVPSVSELESEIVSLTSIFETINNLSVNSFLANERALQAYEASTLGTASASYSIWSDEESRLRTVLLSYSKKEPFFIRHTVSRLPIHNIRLKKPQSSVMYSAVSGAIKGNTTNSISKIGYDENGLIVADGNELSERPLFIKDNQLVTPQIHTLSDDGSGTYTNLVTRGAYCTGSSMARHRWTVKSTFNQGESESVFDFDVYFYKPRDINILAQSVAFEYEFYVRSEPIAANCSLEVNKFRSFLSNSGTSGFLFWRKDWSEAERERAEQSGISCRVMMSPAGETPNYGEQAKRIESIRQAMMQEIAAEFILTYAKSWEISQRQSALSKPNDGAYRAGIALEVLCGINMYCAVGSIILKTGDELFGTHKDKVKNRDFLSGVIRRSYDETSWTISNGQAVIDLNVNL